MLPYLCSWGRPAVLSQSPADRISAVEDEAVLVLSSLSKDRPDDINSCVVIRSCILPRISRLVTDLDMDRNAQFRAQFPNGADRIPGEKYERRIRHIELMLQLVKNRESFGPGFWASIAKWQVQTYQRYCTKLLEDYINSTRSMSESRDEAKVFIGTLEKALQRAYALPEPDEGKAQLSDVFFIRSIYNDPDVRALVASERFTPEKRLEVQRVAEELLRQQPMFPPKCYALQEA
ncbi:hypothetical protein FRC05_003431 [Tulasnella sp. 425]|nr:hypothetical protein FRC05_003431 [Tulasnella sp. 425]